MQSLILKGDGFLTKFIFPIGLIVVGLVAGQIIRLLVIDKKITESVPVAKYIKIMQMLALLGINPIITFGAFWGAQLNDIKFLALPVLGFCALAIGGILGYAASKILGHGRHQTGSMFVSGSFTNMGNFGGLICFVFFGEKSYAFVSMYKLLEEFAYFLIGYPIAKLYGTDNAELNTTNNLSRIIKDPFIRVYFTSIVLGSSLNLSCIVRPDAYETVNSILIPLSSILLITSVGFNMRIKAISAFIKECFAIASVKFLFIPVIITTAGYLIGLGSIENGLLLKVVLVLSAMPPAFNSLIPPQIYGLDVDLANSCWLFGTGALAIVVPILYYMVNLV